MNNATAKIKIYPSKKEIVSNVGVRLIDALWDNNIEIDAFCGGNKRCGKCIVKFLGGNITQLTDIEKNLLSKEQINNNFVLSCERIILGDISIEIPHTDSTLKNFKSFYMDNKEENLSPVTQKEFLSLEKPTLKDHRDDLKRILNALTSSKDVYHNINFEPYLIREISQILKENDYNITATIFDNTLINIEGMDTTDKNYCVVIDLGTTTVAGYLVDMAKGTVISNYSYGNLQKSYGADVISRINYAVTSSDGLNLMSNLSTKSIDIVIENLVKESKVKIEHIYALFALGNTVMSHLLLGVSPIGISRAPFNPAFTSMVKINSNDIGLESLSKNTKCLILPSIGGYVGSDTLGVIISTDIDDLDGNWLAVDIGTNCELVLKTDNRLLTCSTAAGPAFEGACMSYGMRAEEGAICGFYLDENNLSSCDISLNIIGNTNPLGVCGSGYIDIVSQLLKVGILNKQGRLKSNYKTEDRLSSNLTNRIVKCDRGYKFMLNKDCHNSEGICITQEDISQLQLGKGAVRAGIDILMKEANIDFLDGVLLAGAFGSNVNIDNVIKLGMLPYIEKDKIRAIGNAAGSGGIKAVLDESYLEKINTIINKIEHVELSTHSNFSSIFARSIIFK